MCIKVDIQNHPQDELPCLTTYYLLSFIAISTVIIVTIIAHYNPTTSQAHQLVEAEYRPAVRDVARIP